MRRARYVARMGEMREAHNVSLGNPKRKRNLGVLCVGDNDIKTNLIEIG
jgi:hypothetical protein